MVCPFTVRINCSSNLKIFANSRPSASNFKSFSRSLEQFFLTVGQNNFDNKIPFLKFLNKIEGKSNTLKVTHVALNTLSMNGRQVSHNAFFVWIILKLKKQQQRLDLFKILMAFLSQAFITWSLPKKRTVSFFYSIIVNLL